MFPRFIKQFFYMQWLLLALLTLPCSASAANTVEFLGSYKYERFTEEHRYIYQLDLWREADKAFGFFAFNAVLNGDPMISAPIWRTAGDIMGNTVVLSNDHVVVFGFTGEFSKDTLSGRWTDSMTNGAEMVLTKLPASKTNPALIKASLASYEAWAKWAKQYLDNQDANDKQHSKELADCASGDGTACLRRGNRAKMNGNLEKAHMLYESGCVLKQAHACLAIGRVDKAKEILKAHCTGEENIENNFACKTLGKLDEDSGNRAEAKEWYRKGCNASIPLVCPDFKRLDAQK